MTIIENENENIVKLLKLALQKKEGYCPCKTEPTPDNLCICKEFRDQINNPNFYGYCHCGLYKKIK